MMTELIFTCLLYVLYVCVLVAQSCLTLYNTMDCSLPFSVHGIFQARILEWVIIPFKGALPNPGIEPWTPALQMNSLLSEPPERPMKVVPNSFGSPELREASIRHFYILIFHIVDIQHYLSFRYTTLFDICIC